jgi:hypothetical protein
MERPQRLVIVQRGEVRLFEQLRARFGDDKDTVIVYDRRLNTRRGASRAQSSGSERRRRERRSADEGWILKERGFYVSRQLRRSPARLYYGSQPSR